MKKLPKFLSQQGFTLVELVIIIGILTVLFSLVLVAVNPARQFAQSRNTQRRSDVNALINAVTQYMADNNGNLPAEITVTATEVGSGVGEIDICSDLVTKYIAEMPADPEDGSWTSCSSYNTGYTIKKSASDNRVTVAAPSAELSETIEIVR